jgi:hypothetical protein
LRGNVDIHLLVGNGCGQTRYDLPGRVEFDVLEWLDVVSLAIEREMCIMRTPKPATSTVALFLFSPSAMLVPQTWSL